MDKTDATSSMPASGAEGCEAAMVSISTDLPDDARIKLGDAMRAALQRMGSEGIEDKIDVSIEQLAKFRKERRALAAKVDNGDISPIKYMEAIGAITERANRDGAEFSKVDVLTKALNGAGNNADVLFYGRKTYRLRGDSPGNDEEPTEDEGLPEPTELIESIYFRIDRDFDADFDQICLVPSYERATPERLERLMKAEITGLLGALHGEPYLEAEKIFEWFDVTVDRASFVAWFDLRFLNISVAQAPMPTGVAGAPNCITTFILPEFHRRADVGALAKSAAAESRILEKWYLGAHPKERKVKAGSICNVIRKPYKLATKTA